MLSKLSFSLLAVAMTMTSSVMASPTRSRLIEERQQVASITPTAGQMSGNGKPYPSAGATPPQDSLPQDWIDKYNDVSFSLNE